MLLKEWESSFVMLRHYVTIMSYIQDWLRSSAKLANNNTAVIPKATIRTEYLVVPSGLNIVKCIRRQEYDQVIIKRTIGLG